MDQNFDLKNKVFNNLTKFSAYRLKNLNFKQLLSPPIHFPIKKHKKNRLEKTVYEKKGS